MLTWLEGELQSLAPTAQAMGKLICKMLCVTVDKAYEKLCKHHSLELWDMSDLSMHNRMYPKDNVKSG